MIIHDAIGTHYRTAQRIGFDWRGFLPVVDPDTLIITDIIDTSEETPGFRFVGIGLDNSIVAGGNDAAVRV